MGWDYSHVEGNVKQYLKENLTWNNETQFTEVLDIAIVNLRSCYAAVKTTYKQGERAGQSEVWAYIAKLDYVKNDYFNFGKKDMSETCGPYQTNCPKRILELLTDYPGLNDYAKLWRKKCWENINSPKLKLSIGQEVFLPSCKIKKLIITSVRPLRGRSEDGIIYKFSKKYIVTH